MARQRPALLLHGHSAWPGWGFRPPSLPQPPCPRPSPQGTTAARPAPLLRRVSRPRGAARRLAPERAGSAVGGAGPPAGGAGGRSRGGGAKRPFEFPIREQPPAGARRLLDDQDVAGLEAGGPGGVDAQPSGSCSRGWSASTVTSDLPRCLGVELRGVPPRLPVPAA
jgi:hypothetical protein